MSDDNLQAALPSHWTLPSCAPNFSRHVALASEAVTLAQENLLAELARAYPYGRRVQVFHYRGNFFGHVLGWRHDGCRVIVRNELTHKTSRWWAAQVQLAAEWD